MSAIAWSTIEEAIHAWIYNGAGIAADHVIWDYEGGPRPSVPYVVMSIGDVGSPGQDWRTRRYDADTDELVYGIKGHRTAVLTLQCFGVPSRGQSSVPILTDVVSALGLYVDDLDLAGVGFGDVGAVQLVQGQRGGILEPRARVDINLHLASELEKRTDYIQRVQVVVSPRNPEGETLATETLWVPDPPP